MQVEVKEIQRQLGVTTIFVTHDQSEALCLSDRIAVMLDGRIRQIGTPGRALPPPGRPVCRVLHRRRKCAARTLGQGRRQTIVALGAARISVPSEPLAQVRSGDRVDLFVRPEQLRFANAGEPIAVEGTVAAHIYQGGYVNLYLEAPEVCSSHILMRSLEPDAISRWPTGTRVGVAIAGTDAIAFEAEPARPKRVGERGEARCRPVKRTASPQPISVFLPSAGSNTCSATPGPTLPRSSRPTPRPNRRACACLNRSSPPTRTLPSPWRMATRWSRGRSPP